MSIIGSFCHLIEFQINDRRACNSPYPYGGDRGHLDRAPNGRVASLPSRLTSLCRRATKPSRRRSLWNVVFSGGSRRDAFDVARVVVMTTAGNCGSQVELVLRQKMRKQTHGAAFGGTSRFFGSLMIGRYFSLHPPAEER